MMRYGLLTSASGILSEISVLLYVRECWCGTTCASGARVRDCEAMPWLSRIWGNGFLRCSKKRVNDPCELCERVREQ